MSKEKEECCGTCQRHIRMAMNEWCCDNEENDGYGCETAYDDYCPEYEGRANNN